MSQTQRHVNNAVNIIKDAKRFDIHSKANIKQKTF